MYRNYLISALRSIRQSSLYSAISIFCLATGITGAILVSLYVNHELSYDTHYDDHQRIIRIEGVYDMAGASYHLAATPFPLAFAMMEDYAEVENFVRFFMREEEVMVRSGESEYLESGFVLADSTVFDVFSHSFVHGSPEGALSAPNTIVISRSLAEKYFGNEPSIGKTLRVGDENYSVTGVIEDLPDNTHFRYDALISMSSADADLVYSNDPELYWNININYTYILLHQGSSIEEFVGKLPGFADKYANPMGDVFGASATFLATPLRETHFNNIMMAQGTGDRSTLLILSLVALFLVLIAAINYTNLATARAAKRSREIGIRKVTGASRKQLLVQFLAESMLVAFISLVLSIFLAEILLPFFNTIANTSFSLADFLKGTLPVQILFITVFTGLAAGIYPALILSNMNPSLIVKGLIYRESKKGLMRKALVVFQFAISILLVSGTFTVQQQMSFLREKPLGFEKENRVSITLHGSGPRSSIETLEQRVMQNPLVIGTTKAFSVPGGEHNVNAVRIDSDGIMQETFIAVNYVDLNYIDNLGIRLIRGRYFDPGMRSDIAQTAVINETAMNKFGWGDNIAGKQIHMQFDQEGNPQTTLRVIGVVEDFHFLSLTNPVDPMMLILPESPSSFRHLIVQYEAGEKEQVIPFLDSETRDFDQSRIPVISSLEKGFIEEFESDQRLGKIFAIFSLVTIMISFAGLFGLSSFMLEQRKKEIGIRKVLGSSAGGVLIMLYREFSWLILIAVIIAAPLSWYLMSRWLENFTFHIDMSLVPLLWSAVTAFLIAMLTVSYHSLRAAALNPADSLRAE